MKKFLSLLSTLFVCHIIYASNNPYDHIEDILELKKLSLQNDIQAQDKLGQIYFNAKNYTEAEKFYKAAANQNYAPAQNKLGVLYSKQDKHESVYTKWFLLSAKQGDIDGILNMGICYRNKKDKRTANQWFLIAAKQNNIWAQVQVANYYYDSNRPSQQVKAIKWYTRAAEQGNLQSQAVLSSMYVYGIGCEQSYDDGLKWCEIAAKGGDTYSQYLLSEYKASWSTICFDYLFASSFQTEGFGPRLRSHYNDWSASNGPRIWIDFGQENYIQKSYEDRLHLFSFAVAERKLSDQKQRDYYYEDSLKLNRDHRRAQRWASLGSPVRYIYKDETAQIEYNRLKGGWGISCTIQ